MHGILISVNPFVLEQVPFGRTERAVRIAREVFGRNTLVYQGFFYRQFKGLGLRGALPFERYLQRAGPGGLCHVELIPMVGSLRARPSVRETPRKAVLRRVL